MTAEELRIRDAIDRFVSRMRSDVEMHLEALAVELARTVEGADSPGRPDAPRAAVEIARAVARGGSQARHDFIARLADAIRALDDATTLRATLDALAAGASAEAMRVAVLVVDEDMLRSFIHLGFAAGRGPADLPREASEALAASIRLRQVTPVPPVSERPDPSLPAFMRVQPGHIGLVMPVVVGGQVVAVVYADGPDRRADQWGAAVWTEQVEVLVRHAAARLENLTSRRTVEVLTAPA